MLLLTFTFNLICIAGASKHCQKCACKKVFEMIISVIAFLIPYFVQSPFFYILAPFFGSYCHALDPYPR